ncbi:MAG: hypothetical protein DRP65_11375 [Planctomycetota bacterium]|nr:MAG: hypothetical protein DRP65_11375 [Planctomycetota bacterium]
MKHLLVVVIMLSVVLGPVSALGQTKRNPFAPLAKTTIHTLPALAEPLDENKDAEVVELKLNGIIFSKDRPVAIINDEVVEIGSIIAGRRVLAISISHVELQYYDKKETLRITPKFLFTVNNKNQSQGDIQNSVTK